MRPGRRKLRKGCSGRDVEVLQRKLGLKQDGQFGPKTAKAVKKWKRRRGWVPRVIVGKRMWRTLGVKRGYHKPGTIGGTPKKMIDRILWEAQGLGFPHESPAETARANAARKGRPTQGGNVSDHSGDGRDTWAADISNGSSPTKEMDRLANLIAKWYGGKHVWHGSGAVVWWRGPYRFQLIYRSMVGGNHYNHIHIGIRKY